LKEKNKKILLILFVMHVPYDILGRSVPGDGQGGASSWSDYNVTDHHQAVTQVKAGRWHSIPERESGRQFSGLRCFGV